MVDSGLYYIGVLADYYNAAIETDETNNTLAGSQIALTRLSPDLVVTSVTYPSSANTAQQITITYTVKNQGPGSSGITWARLYLSRDNVITTSDIALGSGPDYRVDSLGPGGEQSYSVTVAVPVVDSGLYYIGVLADYYNAAIETDETNNTLAGSQIALTRL